MLKAPLYSPKGEKIKEVSLPASLFGVEVKPQLLTQFLHVFTANQHRGLHQVKTRGQVNRTTAKWYRQKGTGRARHGAKSAPLFVGGGVSHGPAGLLAFRKKLNQKMRQQALLSALSYLASQKQVSLITDLDKISGKTKDLHALFTKLNQHQKVTLIAGQSYPKLRQAGANLPYLSLVSSVSLHPYQVLNSRFLLIDQAALPLLESRLAKISKTPIKSKK